MELHKFSTYLQTSNNSQHPNSESCVYTTFENKKLQVKVYTQVVSNVPVLVQQNTSRDWLITKRSWSSRYTLSQVKPNQCHSQFIMMKLDLQWAETEQNDDSITEQKENIKPCRHFWAMKKMV